MDSERLEYHINLITNLCNDLDFLTSATIEEEMVCSLDCCIGNNTGRIIEDLIKLGDATKSIVGEDGMIFLQQLDNIFDDMVYYDNEKNFSQKPRWLAFVDFACKGNAHLKESIKSKKITEQ